MINVESMMNPDLIIVAVMIINASSTKFIFVGSMPGDLFVSPIAALNLRATFVWILAERRGRR